MKQANSNPMGKASTGGTKPDGAVLRMVKAKVSANLNTGNTVPPSAKLNRPTAKAGTDQPLGVDGKAHKPAHAKLNRKPRTK